MKVFSKKIKKDVQMLLETTFACVGLSWKASKFYTTLRIAGNLFPALQAVFASLLGKYLLDIMAGSLKVKEPYLAIGGLSTGIFLIASGSSVIQKVGRYAQTMHEDIISGQLSLYMMEIANKADVEYFDNPAYHDKLAASMSDIYAIQMLLWNALTSASAFLSFCVVFLIISRECILYGLLILAAAIPSSIASAKYIKVMYELSLEQIQGERKKGYIQALTMDRAYVKSIKLFQAGPFLREKYRRIWETMFRERKNTNRSRTILTSALECLPEFVAAGIGLALSFRVLKGAATVGDYSLYNGLVSQLWSSVYIFAGAVMQILDNQLKIKNLKSLEKFENHVKDSGTKCLARVEEVSFEHVSFMYPGTEKWILQDVSFTVGQSEKVVLVGLNGSGKSTLIKLLLRFYDVQEGCIKINGIDIRNYKLSELRRNFSVYFQDEPSYSFSLHENLTIADLDKKEGDITEAFRASGGGDILEKASKGLATNVTRLFDEDGMELSTGQYQKLALARAFYRRNTMMILDEPSSSLDPKAEHILFEQLREFTKDKIVLFTSHRLTNISLADRIVVLEDGRILEDGTHDELLGAEGRYAELFHYQEEHFRLMTSDKKDT